MADSLVADTVEDDPVLCQWGAASDGLHVGDNIRLSGCPGAWRTTSPCYFRTTVDSRRFSIWQTKLESLASNRARQEAWSVHRRSAVTRHLVYLVRFGDCLPDQTCTSSRPVSRREASYERCQRDETAV